MISGFGNSARTYSVAPIRVGILGCGESVAELHLPALLQVPELDVVAAADPDPGRLHEVADRYFIQGRYGRDAELLAKSTVEMVAVFVPWRRQTERVVAALEAGKHVHLEPSALFGSEALRVPALAQKSGALVNVGFVLRWHPSVGSAVELLRSGRLGSVRRLSGRVTVPRIETDGETAPPVSERMDPLAQGIRSSSGPLLAAALQLVDAWQHLSGEKVQEIAVSGRYGAGTQADSLVLSAWFGGGLRGTGHLAMSGRATAAIEVHGERGAIRLDCGDEDGLWLREGASVSATRWRPVSAGAGRLAQALGRLASATGRWTRAEDALARATRDQWRSFARRILGSPPPSRGIHDAMEALSVLDAAIRSLRAGGQLCDVAPYAAGLELGPGPAGSPEKAARPSRQRFGRGRLPGSPT